MIIMRAHALLRRCCTVAHSIVDVVVILLPAAAARCCCSLLPAGDAAKRLEDEFRHILGAFEREAMARTKSADVL